MAAQGFPPSRRVRRRRDFLGIYACGKKRRSAHFLIFAHSRGAGPQRLGLAVSRKVGNAVARNRVKRLLREYFRLLPFSLPGCDLVAVAQKGAPALDLGAVSLELDPILASLIGRSV